MKLFFLALKVLIICCLSSCLQSKSIFNSKGLYKNKKNALADYAFCKCVETVLINDSIKLPDASIAVIYELSDYSFDKKNIVVIDSIARSKASKIKYLQSADYNSKKAIMLECLNFQRSTELKKIISNLLY